MTLAILFEWLQGMFRFNKEYFLQLLLLFVLFNNYLLYILHDHSYTSYAKRLLLLLLA